jgi:predicted acylesterase/phospholipase RssA
MSDSTIFDAVFQKIKPHITNQEEQYDENKAKNYLNNLKKETENAAIKEAEKSIKSAITSAKSVRRKALAESTKNNYILSIDGGGTRGIMAAIWLKNIERDTNRKISDIFTAIGGTSIGGILALAITLPQPGAIANKARAASTLKDFFIDHAHDIFPSADHDSLIGQIFRWVTSVDIRFNTYNRIPLETLLKEFLGPTTQLKNALSNIGVISVTTSQNPICFNNFSNPTEKGWEVGCATAAAPSYFAAATIGSEQYVDGGLWANNPAALLLAEELSRSSTSDNLKNYVVLSLGTGLMPITTPLPQNVEGIKDGLSIAGPVIETLMNAHSIGVNHYLNKVLNKTDRAYIRVNPIINRQIKLDSIDARVFDELINIAEEEYLEHKTQIMSLLEPRLTELKN